MKILVIGSQPHAPGQRKTHPRQRPSEAFRSFCQEIGIAIAKGNHELIITSDDIDTADRYVALGTDAAGGNIIAYWPKDRENRVPQIPELKRRIRTEPIESGWTIGRVQQLDKADVVLMIGGNEKTRELLPLCLILQVPPVPVTQFDGAARDVFDRLTERLAERSKRLRDTLVKLGQVKYEHPQNDQNGTSLAEHYIRLAVRMRKSNPMLEESALREAGVLIAILASAAPALLGIWLSYQYMILLPILLAWLGSIVLGAILAVYHDVTARPSKLRALTARILRNISGAAIVSLATIAMLVLLQFTMTGKIDVPSSSADNSDYLRISLVAFVIGFACAWQHDRWKEGLSQRIAELGKTFGGQG